MGRRHKSSNAAIAMAPALWVGVMSPVTQPAKSDLPGDLVRGCERHGLDNMTGFWVLS
jgi:hypothetical protein